ncbi:hypothetical protein QVD99_006238 [Batrachochytrium dendrobatidis]|nr:hypothetical protein O5D80_003419 [Batrachochytrium dendrobatidis]KAK5667021.1 hypothetical protein QVD99_006238 [Batrachochytrium dendrobatidis]
MTMTMLMRAIITTRTATTSACNSVCSLGLISRYSTTQNSTSTRGRSHIKRTPRSAINSQLVGTIKLRPTTTTINDGVSPSNNFNKLGQLNQLSWFDAGLSTDPIVHLRALDNSLKAGTDAQLLAAYDSLRALGKEALSKISHRTYLSLMDRVVMTRVNTLYFGNTTGVVLADIALKIRNDYMQSGHQAQQEMDVFTLRAARYAAKTDLDKAVRICRQVIGEYSDFQTSQRASAGHHESETSTAAATLVDVTICNELIAVFAAANQPEICKSLISRMMEVGLQPQITTFCHLLIAYCNVGDMETAETLSVQIFEHGDAEHALTIRQHLLQGYAQIGNITKTQKYFDQITYSTHKHTTETYNASMRVYCERGLPGDAIRKYQSMRRAQVEANADTFTNLIRCYGKGKNITAASRLYYKMENVIGFRPTTDMQTAMIEAYLNCGDSMLAWTVLRHTINDPRNNTTNNRNNSNHPDRDAGKPITPAALPISLFLAISKDLSGKHIDYLRDRIHLSRMPIRSRGVILAKLMQAALVSNAYGPKDPSLVLTLYNEFTVKDGCAVSSPPPPLGHICAIQAMGILGQSKEALKLFETTLDDCLATGMATEAYTAIFSALSNSTDKAYAMKQAQEMLTHFERDGVDGNATDLLEQLVGCFESVSKQRGAIDLATAANSSIDQKKRIAFVPIPGVHPRLCALLKHEPVETLCALIQ